MRTERSTSLLLALAFVAIGSTAFAAPRPPAVPTDRPMPVCTPGIDWIPGVSEIQGGIELYRDCKAGVRGAQETIRRTSDDCEKSKKIKECKRRNNCAARPDSGRTPPAEGSKQWCEKQCEDDWAWTEQCTTDQACADCVKEVAGGATASSNGKPLSFDSEKSNAAGKGACTTSSCTADNIAACACNKLVGGNPELAKYCAPQPTPTPPPAAAE